MTVKRPSGAYRAWAKRGTKAADKGRRKLAEHYAWAAKQEAGRIVATAGGVGFIPDKPLKPGEA